MLGRHDSVVLVLLHFTVLIGTVIASTQQCEYYDAKKCLNGSCNTSVECEQEPNKVSHCFALWKNDSSGFTLEQKGCFLEQENCKVDECVGYLHNTNGNKLYFCCCTGDFCNNQTQNGLTIPSPTIAPTTDPLTTSGTKSPRTPMILVLIGVGFSIVILVSLFLFFMYRRIKRSQTEDSDPEAPCQVPILECYTISVQLGSIISEGRFARVFKGYLSDEPVAVKVFGCQERQAWCTEMEMYTKYSLQHESILRFIGVECRGEGLSAQYLLVTEYHKNGSLSDYLKQNVLSWEVLCNFAQSMAEGMAYLHQEAGPEKPVIAHRDFKTKNVLVKNDLTCCIADFGLALRIDGFLGDMHGQIGTKRYMAPEVIQGSITFNKESFKRLDMYAMGLVLWELVSRCTAQDGPVGEYRLPFEEEVGLKPTEEEIKEVVVNNRLRPLLRPEWYSRACMKLLLETIEECWDHDGEARLTAQCVLERILQMRKVPYDKLNHAKQQNQVHLPPVTTVIV